MDRFGDGLAQLELQAPAVVADLRFAPGFDGSDFGETRAQLHRHQALAGLAEADDGVERRVRVQAFIARREFDYAAERIFGPRERAVEAETKRGGWRPAADRRDRARESGLPRFRAGPGRRLESSRRSDRRCRCSRRAAGRRAPGCRCRSSGRRNSRRRRWRRPDRDRDSRRSPGACRTSARRRRRRAGGRSPE